MDGTFLFVAVNLAVPLIRALTTKFRSYAMNEQNIDSLEIADLEYDVGGVGALEGTDSQASNAAWIYFADSVAAK